MSVFRAILAAAVAFLAISRTTACSPGPGICGFVCDELTKAGCFTMGVGYCYNEEFDAGDGSSAEDGPCPEECIDLFILENTSGCGYYGDP
eukprot:26857_1